MYKYSAPLFVSEISIKPQEPPSHQLRKQKFWKCTIPSIDKDAMGTRTLHKSMHCQIV